MWKLSDVNLPSDFADTVIFNMDNMPVEPITPQAKKSVNIIAIVVILTVVAAIAFFTLKNTKLFRPKTADGNVTTTISVEKTVEGDKESAALFKELESISKKLGPTSSKDKASEGTAGARAADDAIPLSGDTTVREAASATGQAQGAARVHWHLIGPAGTDTSGVESAKAQKEADLETGRAELSGLEAEIEGLKKKSRVEFGKTYSGVENATTEDETRRATEAQLLEKTSRKSALETSIRTIEDEIRSLQSNLGRIPSEEIRLQTDFENKVNSALSRGGIRQEARGQNIFIFSGNRSSIVSATEKLLGALPAELFNDYTKSAVLEDGRDYRGSIYIEYGAKGSVHWHIKSTDSAERGRIAKILRETCGAPERESDELSIFSVPAGSFDKLRAGIRAERAEIREFGDSGSGDSRLSSAPIKLSVYFE